jgi:hypothetical protein
MFGATDGSQEHLTDPSLGLGGMDASARIEVRKNAAMVFMG